MFSSSKSAEKVFRDLEAQHNCYNLLALICCGRKQKKNP